MSISIPRQAAVLVFCALVTSTPPADALSRVLQPTPAQNGEAALSWLRSGATAPRRVSYEGIKSITVWGGQVEASQVQIYHAAPDMTRLEYFPAGAQPKRIVVIKGRILMEYSPARHEIIERPAPEADEERLTRDVLPRILSSYNVSFGGMESVAGRPVRVINVEGKMAGRPSLRIWIDRERRLILRFERYKPDGTLQESSTFLSIQYDPTFTADLFTVPAPQGTQVQQQGRPRNLSLEEIARRVGFTPQVPSRVPSGFQLTRAVVRQVQGQPTAVFVYSDGVSSLTLFESRGAKAGPRGRAVRIGPVEGVITSRGALTVVHWNARGISYTLVGDLPQDDLVQVASSVPQVSGFVHPWLAGAAAAITALGRVPAAEAAEAGTPPAPPSVFPPVSPYITNDTHPTGYGLVIEEMRVWRALEKAGLAPIVVKVAVASDGVAGFSDGQEGRLAWIWFVYGMDWAGGADAIVREVQERARSLAATAFQTNPRIDQVVLTGQYQRRGPFDVRRTDVTFTARLHREVWAIEPEDLDAGLALAQAGDVWYSPDLQAGDLVVRHPRVHEPRRAPRGYRPVAVPGDRSVEAAERFQGSILQRLVETKRRLDGILFGVESGGRLWRGNPRRREIALTFDDGPNPVATPLLLGVLRRYNVRATFFVVGERAAPYPYLVKQMAAEGHEVGDHSFHHPRLTTVDASTVRAEIARTAETLRPLAGRVRWFRPPGGDYDLSVVDAARESGMGLAMWTVNSRDWAPATPKALVDRVLARAEPGAIVLMHDGTLATVRALPAIIAELRQRGYELVTLSDLARGAESNG
jgi:peptidoglycan/xylan/chitin deacetylase (PgdA/CDA1 family)/negative regulator of sigma E activity